MRGVVQVVEPQSFHGPEITRGQIDEIDKIDEIHGHPWSVEGIEERANWQTVGQEKKTRKKQKKTRRKPSPIVVPAGIAELCRLTNSFPDYFAVVHPLRPAYRLHKSAACKSMGEDMLPFFEGMRDKVHTSSRIQVPEEDQPEKLHVPRRIR